MLHLRVSWSLSALNSRLCFWVIHLPASRLQCWAVKANALPGRACGGDEWRLYIVGPEQCVQSQWESVTCVQLVAGVLCWEDVWVWFLWRVYVHPTQSIQERTSLFLSKFGWRQQVAHFLLQERRHLLLYPISPSSSWLQIISVFATLHGQARSEPESLNSRVLWELVFLDGSLVSYCSWFLSKCKPRRWSLPIINSKAGTKS